MQFEASPGELSSHLPDLLPRLQDASLFEPNDEDHNDPRDIQVTKYKGKPKMELNLYLKRCKASLREHMAKLDKQKTAKGKVKYQAIINSLIIRVKRRQDEVILNKNLTERQQAVQVFKSVFERRLSQ
jgi:hypothetical protein